MRSEREPLPLDGTRSPASERQAPGRRGPLRRPTAERQLAFSFEAQLAPAPPTTTELAPVLDARSDAGVPAVLTPYDDLSQVIAAPCDDLAQVFATPCDDLSQGIAPPCDDLARADLERAMALALGVRVEIELTRNRRTMISTARAQGAVRVRLHRMFVEADRAIVEALGRYVKTGDRRASRKLGEFIESRRDRFVAQRPRPTLKVAGTHYDLAAIFADVERAHFPGELEGVAITWGRRGATPRGRRRKRTVRLGTYTHDERLIRVHPVLDGPWVPRFFVEYIVFHEMLHHVEPAREEEGRTIFHTAEFRRRERAYAGYARALEWERANIGKLLSG